MASIEPAPPPSENRKERCNGKQDKTEKEADTHEKLPAYARKMLNDIENSIKAGIGECFKFCVN